MAVLIPSLGASVSRMTTGERSLAERLEQKLDSDYLLWYDVPVGPKRSHPDFIVLHPLRGVDASQVAASGAQQVGGFQTAGGQHQGDDDACQ